MPAKRALAASGLSVVFGATLAAAIGSGVLVTAIGYALLNVSYTLWLRRIAIAAIADRFIQLAGAASLIMFGLGV